MRPLSQGFGRIIIAPFGSEQCASRRMPLLNLPRLGHIVFIHILVIGLGHSPGHIVLVFRQAVLLKSVPRLEHQFG